MTDSPHRKIISLADGHASAVIARARSAQRLWNSTPLRQRLRLITSLRHTLADHATALAESVAGIHQRPVAEKLVSEILPLADACRFLEKNAARILRPKRFGPRGRPLWLTGSSLGVQRKPHGVILIVGPRNYPFFLPLAQTLQALAAGNAVLLKPAEKTSAPIRFLLEHISLPNDLIQILDESPETAQATARAGVDKVIFTGSSENGRHLLRLLAESNTPSVMELSGADFVIIRRDADLERAARAIAFGLRLNAGDTCMAPRHLLAHELIIDEFTARLRQLGLSDIDITSIESDEEALRLISQSPQGLGASIFSRDEAAAKKLAAQLPTGFVTINDLIVPTADPRLPFGGVRASGFGVTRGAEGLLEMTYPHAVTINRSRILPHLDEPHPNDATLFAHFISLVHGKGIANRLTSLRDFISAARRRLQ